MLDILFKIRSFFLIKILKKTYLLMFEDYNYLREINSPRRYFAYITIKDEALSLVSRKILFKTKDLDEFIKYKNKWHCKNVTKNELNKIIKNVKENFKCENY